MRKIRALLVLLGAISLLITPASTAIVRSGALPDPALRLAEFDSIPATCSQPVDRSWVAKVDSIKWVAYSSPDVSPDDNYHSPAADAITRDLQALRKAGFTGLITYGSSGIMGKQFLAIAQALGYKGILMGIWSPRGEVERNNAVAAASQPIVLGYSIGNEGLGDGRYSVQDLCAAISDLRSRTGKPVATSEDIEMYYRWPNLRTVGDWLFPISHPYWHFTKYAPDAIQWEADQYNAIRDALSPDRYVFFKEVGLPTAGAPGLSEANQDAYYRGLSQTDVRFAYFEAFEQPSKSGSSVEPHWGLFNSDLTPKLLAWNMMGYRTFTGANGSTASTLHCDGSASCTVHPAGTLMLVGTDRNRVEYRAALSFNTSALPDQAIVTAAKLHIKSAGIAGHDPLNNRRNLVVDACFAPVDAAGAQPDIKSPEAANCIDGAGVFDWQSNRGWYSVDLLPSAVRSLNVLGATRFTLRLEGAAWNAEERAYFQFFAPDASDSDAPLLLVRYHLP
jgi:exo-beta-1,3-glucanase (GH17 family)